MFRYSASGPGIPEIRLPGNISAGFYSGEPQNRPSGRPRAGRRAAKVPPEALLCIVAL